MIREGKKTRMSILQKNARSYNCRAAHLEGMRRPAALRHYFERTKKWHCLLRRHGPLMLIAFALSTCRPRPLRQEARVGFLPGSVGKFICRYAYHNTESAAPDMALSNV
jgi:hypothetical protein